MPPSVAVHRLEFQAANRIAKDLLNCLIRLDSKLFEIRSINAESGPEDQEDEMFIQRLLETLNREMLSLHSCLETIPGVFLNPIHSALMSHFIVLYSTLDPSDAPIFLTKGKEALNYIRSFEHVFKSDRKPRVHSLPKMTALLSLVCLKKTLYLDLKQLHKLSTVTSNVTEEFKLFLISSLPQLTNLISLDLSSPNNRTCLPQIDNVHVQLIGEHCPHLEVLDASFNKSITGEGIRHLAPGPAGRGGQDPAVHPGCVKLIRLLIFDTGVFEKEVAKLIVHLPALEFLGYKETGKVIKSLYKTLAEPILNLSHIDNRGSKARKMIVSSLRCKKPMTVAISALCPGVQNLKIRVGDDDLVALTCLERVESLELVYHVGSIQSPGTGTQFYLVARGSQLTSLALICHNMTPLILTTIAENCVNLTQLWFRSNHFLAGGQAETLVLDHNYLSKLDTLYLRVGSNELYIVHNFPDNILPYLLRNAKLKELLLVVRSSIINDLYITDLIKNQKLKDLEKVLIVVPGINSIAGILNLTEVTLAFLLEYCKNIRKIGNLLSWNVGREYIEELNYRIKELNWDLDMVNKKMTMR